MYWFSKTDFSKFMFWDCFSYDKKTLCHIFKDEIVKEQKLIRKIINAIKNNVWKNVKSLILNSTKKFQHIYCNVMMTNNLSFDDKHVFITNFDIDSRQTNLRLAVDKLIDKLLTNAINKRLKSIIKTV